MNRSSLAIWGEAIAASPQQAAPVLRELMPSRSGRSQRRWGPFLLFIAPAVALLLATRVLPVMGAVVSTLGPAGDGAFGVYRELFASPSFLNSVRVTLWFSLIINPLQIAVALGLAVLLTQRLPGTGMWRTIVFLPIAVPGAVSTIVWGLAFRPGDGLINSVLQVVGISPQPFLTSSQQALYSIMVLASWIGVGYWMMFLIAGLRDVPTSTLEAAAVDGAGWWRALLYVKIPQLSRPLAFVLVADTVANFLVFVPVQVLTRGGPAGSTNLLMFEIYRQAFTFAHVTYANAHVVVLTMIMLLVVTVQFRLLQRLG